MEWNGMEWKMEWNGMEWNGMEWNGMKNEQYHNNTTSITITDTSRITATPREYHAAYCGGWRAARDQRITTQRRSNKRYRYDGKRGHPALTQQPRYRDKPSKASASLDGRLLSTRHQHTRPSTNGHSKEQKQF